MRADFFLVDKKLRLLELTGHLRQLGRGQRLLQRIASGGQITLRRLVQRQLALQHQQQELPQPGLQE